MCPSPVGTLAGLEVKSLLSLEGVWCRGSREGWELMGMKMGMVVSEVSEQQHQMALRHMEELYSRGGPLTFRGTKP